MASAKGCGVRPGELWQPGCQSGRPLLSSSAVATWLPLQDSAPDVAARTVLISIGNLVATQEGR